MAQVLDLVADIVASFANIVQEHTEVPLVLLVSGEAKGLLQGCDTWFDLLKDRTNRVDGFVILLILGSVGSTTNN